MVQPDEVEQVEGRSMLVKRLKPLPVEAVVRGYLAGSGWKEYQDNRVRLRRGAARGPAATRASCREPIFTPAAKAQAGEHDENISYEQVVEIVGPRSRADPRDQHRDLRGRGRHRAGQGHDHCRHQVRVRPGRGRHAGADGRGAHARLLALLAGRGLPGRLAAGTNPPSYDKQFVRDWLEAVRSTASPGTRRRPRRACRPR